MVGQALRTQLQRGGHQEVSLVRRPVSPGEQTVQWDPYASESVADAAALEGFDAAVHLSGANLSEGRWTPARKALFRSSRLVPTEKLARLLAGRSHKPSVLVCASAIGVYGNRGDEVLTEASSPGSGFLPDLCLAWEAAAKPAEDAGIRVVHLRYGVILSQHGGALKKMLSVFRLGLGGPMGTGRQWMSWVSLPDAVGTIAFAVTNGSVAGAVNVTAPHPVTNADFTRAMGHALHRPAVLPVPAFALQLAFGEMAQGTILSSARVLPQRLLQAGYAFRHSQLEAALHDLLQLYTEE